MADEKFFLFAISFGPGAIEHWSLCGEAIDTQDDLSIYFVGINVYIPICQNSNTLPDKSPNLPTVFVNLCTAWLHANSMYTSLIVYANKYGAATMVHECAKSLGDLFLILYRTLELYPVAFPTKDQILAAGQIGIMEITCHLLSKD